MAFPIVMMSGLIGTGKSTTARRIQRACRQNGQDYVIVSGTSSRVELGIRVYDRKDCCKVQAHMFHKTIDALNSGKGVIIDAIHHRSWNDKTGGRRRVYEFARKEGIALLLCETVCSRDLARKRISERVMVPGVFCDTNDPTRYDFVRAEQDPIVFDLEDYYFSYVTFNTESEVLTKKIVLPEASGLVSIIEEELCPKK
ncbi:hypothetical protein D6825_01680 [Candidatus Woesearchaeota archaeon]|nr:MAG: hypothetical protein D6825_01680 [Candidatus Woesearchaeota archaeon]